MEVKIEKVLGSGGFGTVYLMEICMPTKKVYQLAVKEIRLKESGQTQQMQMIQKEMEIMKSLDHPNIVKFYAGYQLKDKTLLLLEYCDGGNLRDYLERNESVSADNVIKIGTQISSAIDYLHKNKIIHRDIKPENILWIINDNIKVTDFGISRQLNTVSKANTKCGTYIYMAPEIYNEKPNYGNKIDSWSFGCVLHELMYGFHPFIVTVGARSQLNFQISLPEYSDVDLFNLLSNLLVVDDKKRWSMNQALTKLQEIVRKKRVAVTDPAPAPEIPDLPTKEQIVDAIERF